MEKRWITVKEISQFCYCPEQWRLNRLYRQGMVEADKKKIRIKERSFREGILYHRKKAILLWLKTTGITWGFWGIGTGLLWLILWLVMNQ
ncbi:hypothetical protein [Thermoactinomyces mirandus]|uniref:Uncharacterized protein n=1 Tax=Thermoactinomyces mirandus TaxID=2756294 RepID=A0A7W1XT51_9BACL|nr:hypothetical protein [Thermoactinomyces mirandus]MBA4602590.1 hypothetical protein [Thermoactinomyces mirandus]